MKRSSYTNSCTVDSQNNKEHRARFFSVNVEGVNYKPDYAPKLR
jgi:hypothetical protein